MSKTDDVIAICTADWHLSENAPVARSVESDWFGCMRRAIHQVSALAKKYESPVLIAGDLFDSWKPNPVLINFAMEAMPPRVYAIPGNHDTPYHNPELLGQSAYWSLVLGGRIHDLTVEGFEKFNVYGFPFGTEIRQHPEQRRDGIIVALIHDFCWCTRGVNDHKNAPEKSNVAHFDLKGYDAAIFGDNHVGFKTKSGKTNVLNCGTLLRRRADEIDYKPTVGLLHRDGHFSTVELDCSRDKFIDGADKLEAAERATGLDLTGFAQELHDLRDCNLDFRDVLQRRLADNKTVTPEIRKIVLQAAGL